MGLEISLGFVLRRVRRFRSNGCRRLPCEVEFLLSIRQLSSKNDLLGDPPPKVTSHPEERNQGSIHSTLNCSCAD